MTFYNSLKNYLGKSLVVPLLLSSYGIPSYSKTLKYSEQTVACHEGLQYPNAKLTTDREGLEIMIDRKESSPEMGAVDPHVYFRVNHEEGIIENLNVLPPNSLSREDQKLQLLLVKDGVILEKIDYIAKNDSSPAHSNLIFVPEEIKYNGIEACFDHGIFDAYGFLPLNDSNQRVYMKSDDLVRFSGKTEIYTESGLLCSAKKPGAIGKMLNAVGWKDTYRLTLKPEDPNQGVYFTDGKWIKLAKKYNKTDLESRSGLFDLLDLSRSVKTQNITSDPNGLIVIVPLMKEVTNPSCGNNLEAMVHSVPVLSLRINPDSEEAIVATAIVSGSLGFSAGFLANGIGGGSDSVHRITTSTTNTNTHHSSNTNQEPDRWGGPVTGAGSGVDSTGGAMTGSSGSNGTTDDVGRF